MSQHPPIYVHLHGWSDQSVDKSFFRHFSQPLSKRPTLAIDCYPSNFYQAHPSPQILETKLSTKYHTVCPWQDVQDLIVELAKRFLPAAV